MSIYYNLYIASTTTRQARSCNSAASLFFESFLNNNVPYGSINELVQFIHYVLTEARFYNDSDILDRDITIDECFYQLIYSCGFGFIPTEEEMEMIWNILCNVGQEDLNRLFYKNNLFNFIDNTKIRDLIIKFLCDLKTPYMDPNSVPIIPNPNKAEGEKDPENEEAKKDMEQIYDLMREYVYSKYVPIDLIDKMYYLIRSTNLYMDTDSTLLSLDGWYRYVLEFTRGIPMEIKTKVLDAVELAEGNVVESEEEYKVEYDFVSDDFIEVKRSIDPCVIIPQDGLRFSIVNLMSNIVSRLANDYIARYSRNCNVPEGANRLFLKNELFWDMLMLTDAKKHYAGRLRIQEGNLVPEDGKADLDIKGIDVFVKSSVAEETRNKLKRVLYEDILKADFVDQIKVIRDIAIIEKEIYSDIMSGSKKFYKPVKVKSQSSYEDPMRVQGIKAAYAYNNLREPGTEAFDLTIRNSMDIIKVEITPRNIDLIKESHPLVYEKALELFKVKAYATGIDSVAIPLNEPVPGWVIPFVRTEEIINDNVSGFPLESIGIYRGNSNNNETNIISF